VSKEKLAQIAIVLEAVVLPLLGGGIAVEIVTGADIGNIIITCAACLAAVGGFLWAKVLRR
jgi:hypothetical protein